LKAIKAPGRRDYGLRKHLGTQHGLKNYMYDSQKKQNVSKKKEIDQDRKKEIDEAIADAIYTDSRCFGDFNKPGNN
jgi:hypothetical protein